MEGGLQERVSRTMPLAVLLRHLIQTSPVLRLAVEVRITWDPQLDRGGQKCTRERIHISQVCDVERASDAVICRRSALLVLGLLEIWKHIFKSPANIAKTFPMIVIVRIAANVNHGVDCTRSAQHFSPRPIKSPPVQMWLRFGGIVPVPRCLEYFRERYGNFCFLGSIRPASLE